MPILLPDFYLSGPALLLAWLVTSRDALQAALLGEIPQFHCLRLSPDLGAQLESATARGRAAFPELSIAPETFARHLGRVSARMSDTAPVAALAIEDLYLAAACAAGAPEAARVLMARHGHLLERTIERIAGKANTNEILQGLLSNLLVGSAKAPPEIGDYAGRAPLVRWLTVVAQRAALRWLRTERLRAQVAGRAAAEPGLAFETPTELALFRARYRIDFEEALKEALGRATKEERAILRLYIVGNVSVGRIGKMLGVSQSTASRWLAKARQSVLANIKAVLRERVKISSAEIESLAELLQSRLDLSISNVL